jgi:hypothetical protein
MWCLPSRRHSMSCGFPAFTALHRPVRLRLPSGSAGRGGRHGRPARASARCSLETGPATVPSSACRTLPPAATAARYSGRPSTSAAPPSSAPPAGRDPRARSLPADRRERGGRTTASWGDARSENFQSARRFSHARTRALRSGKAAGHPLELANLRRSHWLRFVTCPASVICGPVPASRGSDRCHREFKLVDAARSADIACPSRGGTMPGKPTVRVTDRGEVRAGGRGVSYRQGFAELLDFTSPPSKAAVLPRGAPTVIGFVRTGQSLRSAMAMVVAHRPIRQAPSGKTKS